MKSFFNPDPTPSHQKKLMQFNNAYLPYGIPLDECMKQFLRIDKFQIQKSIVSVKWLLEIKLRQEVYNLKDSKFFCFVTNQKELDIYDLCSTTCTSIKIFTQLVLQIVEVTFQQNQEIQKLVSIIKINDAENSTKFEFIRNLFSLQILVKQQNDDLQSDFINVYKQQFEQWNLQTRLYYPVNVYQGSIIDLEHMIEQNKKTKSIQREQLLSLMDQLYPQIEKLLIRTKLYQQRVEIIFYEKDNQTLETLQAAYFQDNKGSTSLINQSTLWNNLIDEIDYQVNLKEEDLIKIQYKFKQQHAQTIQDSESNNVLQLIFQMKNLFYDIYESEMVSPQDVKFILLPYLSNFAFQIGNKLRFTGPHHYDLFFQQQTNGFYNLPHNQIVSTLDLILQGKEIQVNCISTFDRQNIEKKIAQKKEQQIADLQEFLYDDPIISIVCMENQSNWWKCMISQKKLIEYNFEICPNCGSQTGIQSYVVDQEYKLLHVEVKKVIIRSDLCSVTNITNPVIIRTSLIDGGQLACYFNDGQVEVLRQIGAESKMSSFEHNFLSWTYKPHNQIDEMMEALEIFDSNPVSFDNTLMRELDEAVQRDYELSAMQY